jgi:hypothetical protein
MTNSGFTTSQAFGDTSRKDGAGTLLGCACPARGVTNLTRECGAHDFCKIEVQRFQLNVVQRLSRPIAYVSFEFARELDQANGVL